MPALPPQARRMGHEDQPILLGMLQTAGDVIMHGAPQPLHGIGDFLSRLQASLDKQREEILGDGKEDRVLVLKMLIDRRLRDAYTPGDVAHRNLLDAALAEQRLRCLDDLCPALCGRQTSAGQLEARASGYFCLAGFF